MRKMFDQSYNNTKQYYRSIAWFSIKGDLNLRIDYELNENSIVFDVGSYLGDWASPIFEKYHCRIHIFEPIKEYVLSLRRRFEGNGKIFVHDFGLSDENKLVNIGIQGDSSSEFKLNCENSAKVSFVKISDFIKKNGIKELDLIKLNIEGGEYEVLEDLIESDIIQNIKDIQVQFHDFIPNAEERMRKIQRELEKTHYLTYQFEFVWENWRRKNIPNNLNEAGKEIDLLHNHLNHINYQLNISRENNAKLRFEIDAHISKLSKLAEELKTEKEQRHECETTLNIYINSKSYKVGYFLLHPSIFYEWCIRKLRQLRLEQNS